jgi:hypothetical protein
MTKSMILTIVFGALIVSAETKPSQAVHGDMPVKHLRRLGAGIPSSKAIMVPCQNATSDCGIHGSCRLSGPNPFCNCDDGYFSLELDKPCAEKGETQATMAVLWYLFGWSGASAFVMGWVGLGVAVLLTFCWGLCCCASAKEDKGNSRIPGECKLTCGVAGYLACFGLYIYVAIMLSTSNCVDKYGVPCKSWR